jgi:hypothetical protein
MCSWRAMPPFFSLISMRATRRSSSETIRSSAREECNHAGAPPRLAHVHALSADAPRRGLTRRDCGRLRLNQTRRPLPARTDRVGRPRDSPIRAERRVPITRRTRRFACPSRACLVWGRVATDRSPRAPRTHPFPAAPVSSGLLGPRVPARGAFARRFWAVSGCGPVGAECHPTPVARTSLQLIERTTMWEIESNSVGNGSKRSPVTPG